jgi:tRNA 2-thiouridine synthesizing protein A
MSEHVLDAKGMNCPLPILHAKKKLKDVPVGEILNIEATDPGSVADFHAFCRQTGNEMVEHTVEGDVYVFRIKHLG